LVFPGCKEFALFKSVEENNRFKKQKFLNGFNKITDLKTAFKGDPKNLICGGNLKEIFCSR
jgi:hypothetical protein